MSDSMTQEITILAGRYQVGRLLGRGGMSEVHEGVDSRLGRKVAIKLLRSSLATDPAFRARFRQEAQAAARMAHPTIVRVYDAGEETTLDEGGLEIQVPFIIMEFVEGRLLKDMIADGALPVDEATRIIGGVLTALEFSHRAGVVHRDVKPANIMITPTGQVKVMDFGIARAVSDGAATVAQTTSILGTAQYFSPEQARGEGVDVRTDLYATGVVLFEMLTGRPPFQGKSAVAVAYQHVSEAPVAPSTLNRAVTPALDAVVLHALEKDRADRFQTAADFRTDVEAAAKGELPVKRERVRTDTVSTLFGVNPTLSTNDAAVRQLTAEADERVRGTQTRPPMAWIWLGVLGTIVIITALVVWLLNLQPVGLTDSSVEVPAVVGQTYDEAAATLEEAGLAPQRLTEPNDTVPADQVIRIEPGEGVRVVPGQSVSVFVSLGANPVQVPAVLDTDEAAARAAIEGAGLQVGEVTQDYSTSKPAGTVLGVSPEQGDSVTEGSSVSLVVSNGLVQLEDYTGRPLNEVQSSIVALQFKLRIESDWSCGGNAVSEQSLPAGDQPQGSSITIRYCADN